MAKGYIYTFTEKKPVKKDVTTTRKNKETGEDETITSKKTVKENVKFFVKRPTRRLMDEAETQYAVELSKNMKKGIVTKAMLSKQYSDTGGPLSEDQAKEAIVLMREIQDMEDQLSLAVSTEDSKENKKNIETEILAKKRILVDLENSAQTLYQHTADARAERALLLWYTIQLSWIKEENEEERPFFEGVIYEELVEDLYKKEESDGYESEIVNKLMKIISYWFYSQSTDEKEISDFLKMSDE